MRFKQRSGLYFWSIFLASFGIIPYSIGWVLVDFDLTYDWVGMTIDSIGWVLLVTGHSMVLYSRLHLVVNNQKIMHAVLGMIIANALIWHPSITVLLFGSSYTANETKKGFNRVFNIMEKVQMTFFCIQEFIISGLYIWKTLDILKTAFGSKRTFMWQLFSINIFIVIMDIALLAIEYKSLYLWEQGIKVITYSIKLKLEFAILSQLIEFVQHRGNGSSDPSNPNNAAFIEISGSRTQKGETKGSSNATRARSKGHRERIQMNDMKMMGTTATATVRNSSLPSQHEQGDDKIQVTTSIDVESTGGADRADDSSTDQLYEGVIQEISRSTSAPWPPHNV